MTYDPKASTHAQMVTRNMFQQLGSTYAALSGYLAFALGWTQEVIAAWFAATGIIVWIEYGLETFVRRLSTT